MNKIKKLITVRPFREQRDSFKIEVREIKEIEGGIEFFVQAWKNDKQLGFGRDGSIEIERFRIFNPPVLVDDPNGDIVIEHINNKKEKTYRKLKENPKEALIQSLLHTIGLIGKEGNIVRGKIGNTTSTFYPSSDDSIYAGSASFAAARGASSGTLRGGSQGLVQVILFDGTYYVERGFVNWDTSGLPDTDNINSATVSICGDQDKLGASSSYNIYASTASNPIVSGDFDLVGSTAFSSAIPYANWAIGSYNNYSLNASGIAAITKTGITKFSIREVTYDVGNVAPGDSYIRWRTVEASGTASDPKLVVVHGWANIAKINGVAVDSIAKVNSNTTSSISKINGVSA